MIILTLLYSYLFYDFERLVVDSKRNENVSQGMFKKELLNYSKKGKEFKFSI